MVVSAARAVDMGTRGCWRRRDGNVQRLATGYGCGGRALVRVRLRVPVFMRVSVAPVRCIGAAFGFEGRQLLADRQVQALQHLAQHVVGLELQVVGFQFHRHVPVAQMVGGAQQVAWRAVWALAHHQHRLRCSAHDHQRTVLGHQHVAAAHHAAARQEYTQPTAGGVGGLEAAFLAQVPVQFHGGRALEQGAGQAAAKWHEFVYAEHGDPGVSQNRKYRCAIGSSVAGSQVSNWPSARTS